MRLEQTLQMYEMGERETFERSIYNKSEGLYELYTGGPSRINFRPGILLDGGMELDLKKSTRNTAILREPIDEYLENIYIHHDRGLGREDLLVDRKKK